MGRSQRIALIVVGVIAVFAFAYRDLLLKPSDPFVRFRGSPVSEAKLQDIDGNQISLSKLLAGGAPNKVIAMWATWCDPCVRELPLIEKKKAELAAAGLEVILVNYDGPLPEKSIPEVKAWMISQKINLPTYFDFGEELLKPYEISGLPFAMGIDQTQKINWLTMGEIDWEQIDSVLNRFH